MIPAKSAVRDAPLQGRDKWLLFAGVSGMSFVATFSATAPIASIVPVLTTELRTDVATASWTITIYQLASAGLVLTFGRLADMRGLKLVYFIGCLVFMAGQLASGLSGEIGALIAARAVAGLGGAMLFSTTPALVTRYSASSERGKMLGLQLTLNTFGMALGPALAGLIAERFGWPWVFLATLPFAVAVTALSLPLIPRDPAPRPGRFDLAGAATLLAGVSLVLLALNQGGSWGWMSPLTIGLAVGGVALLAAFIQIEMHRTDPMLDLRLFRNATFAAATGTAGLNYIATASVQVLIPLYLVAGRGMPPSQAGLFLVTQPLTRTIAGPLSGVLADRFGTRVPSAVGMLVYTAGLLMLSRLGHDTSIVEVIAGLVVAGIGAGIFLSPNTSAIMGAAGRHQQGVAAGVVSTARSLGIAFGVVIAGAAVSYASADILAGVSLAFLLAAACTALGTLTSLIHQRARAPSHEAA